jgi:hypothetical protein
MRLRRRINAKSLLFCLIKREEGAKEVLTLMHLSSMHPSPMATTLPTTVSTQPLPWLTVKMRKMIMLLGIGW